MTRRRVSTVWLRVLAVSLTVAAAAGTGGCDSAQRAIAPERVVVTGVWNSTDKQEEMRKFMAVLDRFTERTGIPVQYREPPGGDQFVKTLYEDIAGGNAPDVALLAQPGLLETLAHCPGVLTPLPESVRQAAKASYSDEWLRLGEIDGNLYGLLFKAANKSLIWYDSGALAKGAQLPTTWPEFLGLAESVQQTRSSAVAIGGADQWVLTDWFENVYLRQAGSDKYDKLAKHEIPWTDPSVRQALVTLGELWGRPGLVAGNPATMKLDQSVKEVFDQHNAGMVFEGDFLVNQVGASVGSAGLGTVANFFGFPSFGGPSPAVVAGGDIAVMTRNNDSAAKLMQYLASPDSARIWAAEGGLISANKNVPLDTYPDAVSRQSAADLIEAKVVRFDLSDLLPPDFGSTPDEGLWSGLRDLVAKPPEERGSVATIDRTLNTLEARAKSAYTRPPDCPGS
jgi:alpha-glucoside transport system substrate-binding protein